MGSYVAAIDQGTTSTRLILFDRDGRIAAADQREHEQIHPQAGWVEHDACEVWRRTREVIGGALAGAGRRGGRDRGDRHHQPARDDGRVGPRDRGSRCTTRSSGRTPAPPRWCASSPASRAPTACAKPSGCRCRPTSPARRSPGSSTTCRAPARARRGRRAGLRHHGHLAAVEPDRRAAAAACTRPT